jgi:hypothetical protein
MSLYCSCPACYLQFTSFSSKLLGASRLPISWFYRLNGKANFVAFRWNSLPRLPCYLQPADEFRTNGLSHPALTRATPGQTILHASGHANRGLLANRPTPLQADRGQTWPLRIQVVSRPIHRLASDPASAVQILTSFLHHHGWPL